MDDLRRFYQKSIRFFAVGAAVIVLLGFVPNISTTVEKLVSVALFTIIYVCIRTFFFPFATLVIILTILIIEHVNHVYMLSLVLGMLFGCSLWPLLHGVSTLLSLLIRSLPFPVSSELLLVMVMLPIMLSLGTYITALRTGKTFYKRYLDNVNRTRGSKLDRRKKLRKALQLASQ